MVLQMGCENTMIESSLPDGKSIKEFIEYYHKNDYIYNNVLKRYFGDFYEDAVYYYTKNGIVKRDNILICPECRHMIMRKSDFNEMSDKYIICWNCGKCMSNIEAVEEIMFVKI